MGSIENGTKMQVGEKHDAPALPALFTFVK